MKRFNTQQNKLKNLIQQSNSNQTTTRQVIKKIDVKYSSVNYLKKVKIITLLDDFLMAYGSLDEPCVYRFDGFPDWAVNHTKPFLYVRFLPDYKMDERFIDDYYYYWKTHTYWVKTDGAYSLYFKPDFYFDFDELFITFKLYVLTEKYYNELQ